MDDMATSSNSSSAYYMSTYTHTHTHTAAIRSTCITTDIEEADNRQKEREGAAEKAIDVIGDLLENADDFVMELESNAMLGSAIVRRCRELADLMGNLAGEMEGQSDEDKRILAQACLEDAARADAMYGTTTDTAMDAIDLNVDHQGLATLSETDMIDALSGAQALIRDIESALRSIDRSEADEIADVALTMARLFILSLKNIHSTLTPEQLLMGGEAAGMHSSTTTDRDLDFTNRFELLDDEGRVVDGDNTNIGAGDAEKNKKKSKRKPVDRVRALWPPLGPAAAGAAQWGKENATKKPLLAIALGLTLWPAAIMTALIGTPLVLADGLVQHAYNSLSDSDMPLVATLERGAAQVYQAGKLSFLCSGLVVRQTLRVASRQVKRHGGAGKLAQDVGGAVLDRVTHPIQTAGMAWGALCFSAGALRDGVGFVQDTIERQKEFDGRNVEIIMQ
jgi:hypothetical protein